MEKLELKHLAPYLPYGLKLAFIVREEIICIDVIRNLYDIENYDDIKLSIGYSDGEHIWMYKPILRPLSCLFNGDLDYLEVDHDVDFFSDNKGLLEYIVYNLESNNLYNVIDFLPKGLVDWLVSKHYDVFGLIEKGLSIDINTLNK